MSTAAVLPPDETMTKQVHTTLAGHRVEYEATPKVTAFLTRLEDMISNPKVSQQEMIGFAYSGENPLLDQTLHPSHAMVTKEVFANPAYQVIGDLLFRKRVAAERVDVDKLAGKYTLTVSEAAEISGLHQSAIRQAIDARRLASWMKDGKHFIDPKGLAAFSSTAGTRGPKAKAKEPANELDIVLGHAPGESLRVRAANGVETVDRVSGNIVRGRVAKWERVVVMTTRGENKRAFLIAPGEEENEIKHGPFYVRGRFTIVSRENSTKKAGSAYDTIEVK